MKIPEQIRTGGSQRNSGLRYELGIGATLVVFDPQPICFGQRVAAPQDEISGVKYEPARWRQLGASYCTYATPSGIV